MNTGKSQPASHVSEEGGGWWALYDAIVPLAVGVVRCGALFHPKLRESLAGRRGGVRSWRLAPADDRPLLLVHTASRGEFEGARILLERLLGERRYRLAVSFSSPSVQSAVTKLEGLWASGYLPLDRLSEQLAWLKAIKPCAVVVFKHDLWPNMIRAAQRLGIPLLVANANFHPRSQRNLPLVRSFHRVFMNSISTVWTVSEADAQRAAKFLSPQTELATLGDTRYDRVMQLALSGQKRFAGLKAAFGAAPVVIIGSSWHQEERIAWVAFAALRASFPELRMIVVPHEPTAAAIKRNRRFAEIHRLKLILFTGAEQGEKVSDVMLVDKMGLLAELYTVGWAAFVGGGFGVGVHSVLEPAAHGLPVAFGPHHHVSHEAGLLLEAGGGAVVQSAGELERLWRGWLENRDSYRKSAAAAYQVAASRAGATDRLIKALEERLTRC